MGGHPKGSTQIGGRAQASPGTDAATSAPAGRHAPGSPIKSALLVRVVWRIRRACGARLVGGVAAERRAQKLTRRANAFLIFAERIASRGIDGLGDRAGHGIPLHVMNGTAPNPWEGWASTGKVENRYIPIGTAEAVQAWLAPGGRRSQAIANEDKNLCSVPARYVQGFHTSIAFPMAPKAMAQSVPMAASSEQGRNYKSEFADDRRQCRPVCPVG